MGEVTFMLQLRREAVSIDRQVEEFTRKGKPSGGEILEFAGVGDADVYNPSIPFRIDGSTYMAGRMEKRDGNRSYTMFFTEAQGVWKVDETAPVFELEDPFITWIAGELILGGVRVIREGDRIVSWVTDFYRGTSLHDLELFATGPDHMKDIRLVELTDGRIGVFSRPQGEKMLSKFGCIAKIGFTIIDSLSELNAEVIDGAPLLEGHFQPDEWGGCNQLYMLKNGLIGAIGHKAHRTSDEQNRERLHYYSIAFAIEPDTRKMTPVKIIASRDCFPQGEYKSLRVADVTFTSGVVRLEEGKAMLYSGLSDCQVGRLMITDPLLEYEAM